MTTGAHGPVASELPTFSQCVIGYRRWQMDERGRLWPLWMADRPWEPGINVARCPCGSWTSLRFTYRKYGDRHVLAPESDHAAPAGECTCGLYSWRRPPDYWHEEAKWSTPPRVVGAVASWGRMQVHRDGFRAEFACIVTLAWHPGISTAGLNVLGHLARDYRAELVAMDQLEEAARRHGSPLPDTLRPPVKPPLPPIVRAPAPAAAERTPEKQHPAVPAGWVVSGTAMCALGIVSFGSSWTGWAYGLTHEHYGRADRSAIPTMGVVWIVFGLVCVAIGLWLFMRDHFLDEKLSRLWQRRARREA